MTNRTPRPTDALPLPELPTTSYLGDGNGYGYDSSDMYAYGYIVRREGYELAKQALVKPIHDPAVTTPREVLVGESPVDRIAAPAQEQPISKADADYWLSIRPGLIDALAARGLQIVSNKDGVRVVEQQQAGAASLLADALRKLLARTSGEHYPVEQELARTALSAHDDAFRQECDDADELIRLLGLDPESCRTDGGFINMPRVRSLLMDRYPYGVLSELLECFDSPYPPETAGRDAQSAWGDRRAAAKEQARAILAPKAAGAVVESPKYRLLQRNVDEIMADDEFLSEDASTWAVDPNGIFVGLTYGGVVLRPARRALKAGGVE